MKGNGLHSFYFLMTQEEISLHVLLKNRSTTSCRQKTYPTVLSVSFLLLYAVDVVHQMVIMDVNICKTMNTWVLKEKED